MRPQFARVRMQRGTLHVAVAVAPDLGQRTGRLDERVVGRHAAVGLDANGLAEVRVEVLRFVSVREAFAQGDEEPALAVEDEARAEMGHADLLVALPEDHGHAGQLVARQFAPGHRRAVLACIFTGAGLGIAQINEAAGREVGIEGDVEQAALAAGVDVRHARQRRAQLAAALHDAQPAGAFGDEHPAIGQEREPPGVVQARCHRRDGQPRLGQRGGAGECEQHEGAAHRTGFGKAQTHSVPSNPMVVSVGGLDDHLHPLPAVVFVQAQLIGEGDAVAHRLASAEPDRIAHRAGMAHGQLQVLFAHEPL